MSLSVVVLLLDESTQAILMKIKDFSSIITSYFRITSIAVQMSTTSICLISSPRFLPHNWLSFSSAGNFFFFFFHIDCNNIVNGERWRTQGKKGQWTPQDRICNRIWTLFPIVMTSVSRLQSNDLWWIYFMREYHRIFVFIRKYFSFASLLLR